MTQSGTSEDTIKTCKHLKGYFSVDYEVARLGGDFKRFYATGDRVIADGAQTGGGGGGGGKKRKKDKATQEKTDRVMLADKYYDKDEVPIVDPTGWYLSEKLDGMRAWWDSKERKFYARSGNLISCPDFFTAGLPSDTDLDGELWAGRGKFGDVMSVKQGGDDERWRAEVVYMVYDAPSVVAGFEARMSAAKAVIPGQRQSTRAFVRTWGTEEGKQQMQRYQSTGPTGVHAMWLGHWKCEGGVEEVERELASVVATPEGGGGAGEGLMVIDASALYRRKRSSTILKIKQFKDDEAIVLEHVQGQGKHANVMGSLRCRLRSGVQFKVGSGFNDEERQNPPAVGSVITFKVRVLVILCLAVLIPHAPC
jgi:DNA ligase-1